MALVPRLAFTPISTWNNPEPEAVIVVNSKGRIIGATLGNDMNLRDVEGRSALLLGKAKDNNASASLGPFIRLFDVTFSLEDVNTMEITLEVEHDDGLALKGMSNHEKDQPQPGSAGQCHTQCASSVPGLFRTLSVERYLRPRRTVAGKGQGFTHKHGDRVSVANPHLGVLFNTVRSTDQCPPWGFGASHLMRNLAERDLL